MDSPAALRTWSKDELIALVATEVATTATARSKYTAARARCETAEAEVDKLHLLIKQLQRTFYGRRTERLDRDQLQIALEDVFLAPAWGVAASLAVDLEARLSGRFL